MKKMRKVAGMLMAATVAMAMPMSTMAATIIVDGQLSEAYKAYKIFDYSTSGDAYAYTIDKNSPWRSIVANYPEDSTNKLFTLTQSKGNLDKYIVEVTKTGSDGKVITLTTDCDELTGFAKYLATHIPSGAEYISSTKKTIDEENKVVFDDLDKGYYFVNTTTGALCSLVNGGSTQELKDKNQLPGVAKEILKVTNTGSSKEVTVEGDTTTATIGDTITYKITVTNGVGTNGDITIHDNMGEGLTLNADSIEVKVNNAAVPTDKYVKVTSNLKDGCDFEITLKEDYVKSLGDKVPVIIEYTAVLNEKATIGAGEETKNTNNVHIHYSNTDIPDPGPDPEVKTYEFGLVKTAKNAADNDSTVLNGAKFKLYADSALTKEIKLVLDATDGAYRPALADETPVDVIDAGVAQIKGLGNGIYYLKETEAPQGYNALKDAENVTINNASNNAVIEKLEDAEKNVIQKHVSGGVKVVNSTGTILPSTGGIGTTIFYAAGIVVMAGAVFFVVRSRKHD